MEKKFGSALFWLILVVVGCHKEEIRTDPKNTTVTNYLKNGVVNSTMRVATVSNNLLAFAGNGLYSINSTTMAVSSQLPWTWDGTTAATISNGSLFAIQYGTLYKLNLSNYQVWDFGHYWDGTNLMTHDDYGNIYAIQGAILYRINPNNGTWVELNLSCDWTNSTDMAFTPNSLDSTPDNLVIQQYGEEWIARNTTGNCLDWGPDRYNGGPIYIGSCSDGSSNCYHTWGLAADGSIILQSLYSNAYTNYTGTHSWQGATDITGTSDGIWIVQGTKLHKAITQYVGGGNYSNFDQGIVQLDNVYKVVSAYSH